MHGIRRIQRSESFKVSIEAPVGDEPVPVDEQHHLNRVGHGGVPGLPPAPLQDPLPSRSHRRLIQVDLIALLLTGVRGSEVLQVELQTLPRRHLDGPVAPHGGVWAQVIRGEELTAVFTEDLMAAAQGIEGVSLAACTWQQRHFRASIHQNIELF